MTTPAASMPRPLAQIFPIWVPSIYGQRLHDQPEMMHLYGVGDHGGGPTRAMLDHARALMAPDRVFPKLEFSSATRFLRRSGEEAAQR